METRVGKYLLRHKLGTGTSGTVHLALDEFSGREVAIKFYNSPKSESDANLARVQFLTEAALAGRLVHPHIAAILDAAADDKATYVVTEYVAGGNLTRYAEAGSLLPVPEVIELAFKCAGALDYAFRNSVVHRDIKPANILRSVQTGIKVTDFGVAYLRNADHTQITSVGSPYYASPEQATGAEVSHLSDMFSLGVVLYELLTGRRPFGGETGGMVLYHVVSSEPEPLLELRPDLPAELATIVARALRKKPGDRYENWAEFALDLAKAGRLSRYDADIPDSAKFMALKRQPVLAVLDDAELWEFVNAGRWSRLPAQQAVLREGEAGDSLYLLAEGEAKVTLQGRLLNVLGTGEWFGEQSYVGGGASPRQATVQTTMDSVVVEFPIPALDALSERCQKRFAKALLRLLAERLALSNVRISRMA
jgi:serine/threonine protein kinase